MRSFFLTFWCATALPCNRSETLVYMGDGIQRTIKGVSMKDFTPKMCTLITWTKNSESNLGQSMVSMAKV